MPLSPSISALCKDTFSLIGRQFFQFSSFSVLETARHPEKVGKAGWVLLHRALHPSKGSVENE